MPRIKFRVRALPMVNDPAVSHTLDRTTHARHWLGERWLLAKPINQPKETKCPHRSADA
jgi:hypothetical protein